MILKARSARPIRMFLPVRFVRHGDRVVLAGHATLNDGRVYEAFLDTAPDPEVVIPVAARRRDIPDYGESVFAYSPNANTD